MKTFILSLVVLALILGLLVFTGSYLLRRSHELSEAAEAIPSSFTDDRTDFRIAAERFRTLWSSARKTVRFIIGRTEADRIDELFAEAGIRFAAGDTAGYLSAREKLLRAVRSLGDAEKLSFDVIA